jgi:hypothetical protein
VSYSAGISLPMPIYGKIEGMKRHPALTPRERQEEADRFTTSLAGLAAALLLGLIGLWVADGLAQVSKLEDCLLQGRMNCERIELSP